MSTPAEQRAQAAQLVHRVAVRHKTTDQAMAGRDLAPLTQELALGSLRHFFSLKAAVASALHRDVKPKDRDLWALLIVGAYQLYYSRIPDHAAIFETVNACQTLGKPWARGMVNAVLRALSGRPPPVGALEHPDWLDAALRREYPDAEAIMAANNTRAPMALRINTTRIGPADYLGQLTAAGMASRAPCPGSADGSAAALGPGPETRILETPVPVARLPGYREGRVSVQDAGAQFAPMLLSPAPGERVLDACAAPGGKLFHLLERHPQAEITGVEKSPERLAHLTEMGRRLGHVNYAAVAGDATELGWWDGRPFTHILLDAPCSGTGTLRRHPDIKLLRAEKDVNAYSRLQSRLLANLWQVLAPGGTLLYCTCSLLAGENDEVVDAFLAVRPDARLQPFRLVSGRGTRHGWQLLPTDEDTDGFYYSRMTKAAS